MNEKQYQKLLKAVEQIMSTDESAPIEVAKILLQKAMDGYPDPDYED